MNSNIKEGSNFNSNNNYIIANITSEEESLIKKAEQEIKNKTGKDLVMIAWQEKKN